MITNEIVLGSDASCDQIVSTIGESGLAIFPEFLSKPDLDALNTEFDRALDPDPDYGRIHVQAEDGIISCLQREKLPTSKYPLIGTLFGSDWMRDIADRFYGEFYGRPDNSLNSNIFVNKNYGVAEAVQKMPYLPHFDQLQTLKFFIYLDDTFTENGAMGVDLESHKKNRQTRDAELACSGDYTKIKTHQENARMEPVEGKAGTLFIFDTDVTHCAGHVQLGKTRRIIRGHTRAAA